MRKHVLVWGMALAALVQVLATTPAAAQQAKKPNILVI